MKAKLGHLTHNNQIFIKVFLTELYVKNDMISLREHLPVFKATIVKILKSWLLIKWAITQRELYFSFILLSKKNERSKIVSIVSICLISRSQFINLPEYTTQLPKWNNFICMYLYGEIMLDYRIIKQVAKQYYLVICIC